MNLEGCKQEISRIQSEFATANQVQLQQLQIQYNQMLGFQAGWAAREELVMEEKEKEKEKKVTK